MFRDRGGFGVWRDQRYLGRLEDVSVTRIITQDESTGSEFLCGPGLNRAVIMEPRRFGERRCELRDEPMAGLPRTPPHVVSEYANI